MEMMIILIMIVMMMMMIKIMKHDIPVDRNHETIIYHPPAICITKIIIIEINMLMIINHHHHYHRHHHNYYSINHIPLIVYTLLIDQKWMELSMYLLYVTIKLSSIQWKSSHRDA